MCEKYRTIAETEALLRAALDIKGSSTKSIAAAIGLQPNTLYAWRCGNTGLSSTSLDKLFSYLRQNEPQRIEQAAALVEASFYS